MSDAKTTNAIGYRARTLALRVGGWTLAFGAAIAVSNCGDSSGTGSGGATSATGVTSGGPSATSQTTGTSMTTSGTQATSATSTTSGTSGTGGGGSGFPSGWLYTNAGKIYESDGNGGGTQWMGRGVNMDDIFLCGYDNTLWMQNPGQNVEQMVSGLMSAWKPNFVRMSLSMASYPTVVSWTANAAQYQTPMTSVINAIGATPGAHVLVTLRSEASMIGQDNVDGDPEATGVPSDATTTPNANQFPNGTDPTYVALVDTFANSGFVMFGITNEPGGNKDSNAMLRGAMSHAVDVIRAEEDKLGVPHHLISVQGNGWTSDISFYAANPLTQDNIVYEVHGYPPATGSYTYSNIPVIIGEYGSLNDPTAFYADLEAKQIPNLAWDFDSYSNCAPDLLTVNQSSTNLVPSSWGSTVQAYLLAHAP